jgi:hypothetical protein
MKTLFLLLVSHRLAPSPGRRLRFALVALTLAWLAVAAGAQGPDAAWRTLETERYRVHYPAPAEDWVLHLAQRLEPIRDLVEAEVRYADPAVVDILIQDPLAAPNGFAWPIPGSPRLVLWLTPPGASSVLAHYQDWAELLMIHEQAHLSHLLRPSRNPFERRVERHLLPVRTIALRSPRWVSEGYATVLEGRLTGAGRPHAHFRAALLRRWAQEGRLPSYAALEADPGRWMGNAMAYLAGSAYLEWLEERVSEPESLWHLWRRMTARERRSFDEAFRGVFGDSPANLYARFTAELTHAALESERLLEPILREGELVRRHDWSVGSPAVSPDGSAVALVRQDRRRPPRLVVLATAVDEEAVEERRRRREELLERDPEDVPGLEVGPPPREVLHQVELRRSTIPHEPRWLPDGALLFTQAMPDARGDLHGDLFRWHPGEGSPQRLTRGAGLRQADPAPDGTWAVAVRSRWGKTELVRVELAGGQIAPLTGEPRVDVVYDAPRLSPDGQRLAFLRHHERWELVVRDLPSGAESVIPTPEEGDLASPAWSADGSHLYLVVGSGGLLDLEAFPVAPVAQRHQVTRSRGGALAPAPAPDGRFLYYLSIEPDGLDLRLLDLDAATIQVAELPLTPELFPAVPPPPPEIPPLPLVEAPAPRPYGLGRAEWSLLSGGGSVPAGGWLEMGARGGDLVGRWELLALGSWADGAGPAGGAVTGTLRRYRLPVTLHLFAVEEVPSRQSPEVPGLGGILDLRQRGAALGSSWDRHLPDTRLEARFDGVWTRLEAGPVGEPIDRRLLSLEAGGVRLSERGSWRVRAEGVVGGQLGDTGGQGWRLASGRGELALAGAGLDARVSWEGRSLSGRPAPADRLRLGGLQPTSLPSAAVGQRLFEPALSAGSLVGRTSESWRVSVARRGSGLRPFWARHTLRDGEQIPGLASGTLELAGLELEVALPPFPLLRLPELRLHAGGARLLGSPFERRHRGWVGLTYRP